MALYEPPVQPKFPAHRSDSLLPPPRPVNRLVRLPVGWPILGALGLYPLWAIVGLSKAIWVVAAVPMAIELIRARNVKVPRGTGIWVAFLAWVPMSALMLKTIDGPALLAFSYRWTVYAAALVIMLYMYNQSPRQLPTRRVLIASLPMFGTVLLGGYLGMVLGEIEFPTVLAKMLPGSLRGSGFAYDLVQPRFAQDQGFLGFSLKRPAYPFRFTNEWGGVMALLIGFAMASLDRLRFAARYAVLAGLGLTLIPFVVSLNRGLWISVAFMMFYVAIRRAQAGQVGRLVQMGAFVTVVLLIVALSPLGDLVNDRAESDHSNGSRSTLYLGVIEQIPDSPLLGFGAPRIDPDFPLLPPVGTHGHLWTVLYSHGIPALGLYLWFLMSMAIRSGGDLNRERIWLHATFIVLMVQMVFYNAFPGPLALAFLALGLLLRAQRWPEHRGALA